MNVEIYTDGSYKNGHSTKSGWAFVVVHQGILIHEESGITAEDALSWNIDGEAEAAWRAAEWCRYHGCNAIIYSDYIGIPKCAKGEWKAKSAPLKLLKAKVLGMDYIVWKWVKGHSGNEWNDRADRLAGAALARCAEAMKP